MNHHLDENENRLILTVNTGSYANSVTVSMKAFLLAEKLDHHPTVTTHYDKVVVEISTHGAGNKVTDLDRQYIRQLTEQL